MMDPGPCMLWQTPRPSVKVRTARIIANTRVRSAHVRVCSHVCRHAGMHACTHACTSHTFAHAVGYIRTHTYACARTQCPIVDVYTMHWYRPSRLNVSSLTKSPNSYIASLYECNPNRSSMLCLLIIARFSMKTILRSRYSPPVAYVLSVKHRTGCSPR